VLEETHDNDQIIQRVAALDIGKAELVCCVRVPHPDRQTAAGGGVLPDDDQVAAGAGGSAGGAGVTRVVMEATSDY
jgi:transposase